MTARDTSASGPQSGSLEDNIGPGRNQEKLSADLCHSCSQYKH